MDSSRIVVANDAIAFRAEDGRQVIYPDGFHAARVAYSPPDATTYYQLAVETHDWVSPSEPERHVAVYEDPHHARKGSFRRHGDVLVLDGAPFKKVTAPREITLVALPAVRRARHLFRLVSDGRFVYVSSGRYARDLGGDAAYRRSFKVYIGDGEMRELAITDISESDVLMVVTTEGTLRVPGVRADASFPVFGEEPMEELILSQFAISDTPAGVTIHGPVELEVEPRGRPEQRTIEQLQTDVLDPVKHFRAVLEFGPGVGPSHVRKLLLPGGVLLSPSHAAEVLLYGLQRASVVGELGHEVPFVERTDAAREHDPDSGMLQRFNYVEVWRAPRGGSDEPELRAIYRFAQHPRDTRTSVTFTIGYTAGDILRYVIDGIYDEADGPRGA